MRFTSIAPARWARVATAIVGVGMIGAGSAAAQAVCTPAASTPEARLLMYFAGPLAFGSATAPTTLGAREVAVVGELTYLPDPPAEISRSGGACGFTKSENAGLAPVLPRPRVAIGLGRGLAVEASWLPPVTVADATPHLAGIALSWATPVTLPGGAALVLRAHATIGGVDGPVTCPRSELQTTNPAADCYGSIPSDDTYDPNVRGVEAMAHRSGDRWGWLAGLGVNAVAPRFRVNFTDQRGFTDRNLVQVDLVRVAGMIGVTWKVAPALTATAQVYSVPQDATTIRTGLAWRP